VSLDNADTVIEGGPSNQRVPHSFAYFANEWAAVSDIEARAGGVVIETPGAQVGDETHPSQKTKL